MLRTDLTKAQRLEIAEWLAEDRLDKVNLLCEEVHVRDTVYVRYVKRILDLLFSVIALLLTFPINLLIGVITFFDVGKPIFFKQIRIGKNGKPFELVKFRNMTNTRDENGDLLHASLRVTKFGKFVRKTSLDELLNFWSIFKGDMSFIGPRPLVAEYVNRYNNRHYHRLAVKPGLECPPKDMNINDWGWQEQFENDVWYVENISFLTDCKMLIQLIRFAIDPKVSTARSKVSSKGSFMGYNEEGKAINLDEVPQKYIDFYETHHSRYE